MKKFLLPFLFLLLVLPGISQTYVYVSGYVTDSATGSAIPNHAVMIISDSSGGFVYYNTVYTNANGWYSDTIPAGVTTGSLYIHTYDCAQVLHTEIVNFDPSNLSFTVNFSICNSPPPCQAFFFYSIYPNGLVYFTDSSSGNPTSWAWNFGDGGTSTEQNPVYQYNASGYYTATLTIANSSGCSSTFSSYFYVNNSGGGCQAYYIAYPDSSNTNSYYFYDQSQGNISSWSWDFGDPASGNNNTSTQQNPVHIFSVPGMYNVCLTIQGDSSCTDTYCQTIMIGGGSDCHAYFYTYPDSLNNPPYTYNFIDQSIGNISTWTWNFGDGTYQTITYPASPNVTHTYAQPGIYGVCLWIQGNDSTCFDYYCDTLVVGGGGGCQADFAYYSAGINTIQFLDYSTGTNGPWNWTFGDGATSTDINPLHVYASSGVYPVTLTIGIPGTTCYDSKSMAVYVNDSTGGGCQASFIILPDSMNVPPYSYHFIDQSIGNIVAWSWNFGDGNGSAEQSPHHTYNQPGIYSICLTVFGADSTCYDITCDSLLVGNSTGCQAFFNYSINPASGTTSVQFTDQSSGNPTQWYWNFGDSSYSTEQNPLHIYPAPGSYFACLTITSGNCMDTYCTEIIIEDSTVYQQVYGQVFEGNFPLQTGYAMIFSIDSLNSQPFVDVCPIDSNGIYYFSLVPYGNFLVYAIPLDYNGYLPTYYGDVLNWTEATVISLGEPNNPYDIHLVMANNMPEGEGTVSGQINVTGLKSTYLDKVVMLLMNDEGQVIYYDPVSTTGTFDFSNMAYGTYYLHAEMAGISSDNVKVILTAEQPHADVVMTFNGNSILGLDNGQSTTSSLLFYPNPAKDIITLMYDLSESSNVTIEIYNLRGQIVLKEIMSAGAGHHVKTLALSRLSAGFYTLNITTDKGERIARKLIISR